MVKNLAVVAVVLSVLGTALWLFQKKSSNQMPSKQGHTILETLDANALIKIQLKHMNQSLVLEKQSTGNWMIADSVTNEANPQKIQNFLLSLMETKVADLISSAESDHPKFEVAATGTTPSAETPGISLTEENGTIVSLFKKDGSSVLQLIIGKTRPNGGQYIRFEGDSSVYLIAETLPIDFQSENWINKTIIQLDPKQVQSITFQRSGKNPFILEKSSPEQSDWTSASLTSTTQVNQGAVTAFLQNFESLEFAKSQPVTADPKELGLESLTHVKLGFFDGHFLQIEIGEIPASDNNYYLKAVMELKPDSTDQTSKGRVDLFNQRTDSKSFGIGSWIGQKILKNPEDFVQMIQSGDEKKATKEGSHDSSSGTN